MKLAAEQMTMLPSFFANIPDPRRTRGRRHSLRTVLSISAAAVLCGMSGYKAIAGWAEDLGQKARARFGCRRVDDYYHVPSESIIRDVLVRVSPDALDSGLQKWNAIYGSQDTALAVDGKTMCNAIDDEGNQTHIMSIVGHEKQIIA
ncbi:MAG: transposase family protein [Legionellaceae bacterium]|nr:transposase family protein [Legionellaceae bacterium]